MLHAAFLTTTCHNLITEQRLGFQQNSLNVHYKHTSFPMMQCGKWLYTTLQWFQLVCVCVASDVQPEGFTSRSSLDLTHWWRWVQTDSCLEDSQRLWAPEPEQQPHHLRRTLELSEEPGTSLNIHTLFFVFVVFKLGLMGASHTSPDTHQEIIVGEQQQVSERVFLQLVPEFRDDGLIVEWIDRLRLLLLRRHTLDSRLAWNRSLPDTEVKVQPRRRVL